MKISRTVLSVLFSALLFSRATAQDCPPAGVIGWWMAESNAVDSANALDGTLTNGVGFAPGKRGVGFDFDGSGSYVRIPDNPLLAFTNQLTIEFWYKETGMTPGTYGGLIGKRATNPSSVPTHFGINMLAGPVGVLQVYYVDPNTSVQVLSQSPLPTPGVFHHLAATYRQAGDESVEMQLFVDGLLAKSGMFPGKLSRTTNSFPVTLGVSSSAGEYFKGVMDEVTLYNRVLSSNEVQAIFNAGASGKCAAPVLQQEPVSQFAMAGDTVTFTGLAGGLELSYQWFRDGSSLAGATNASLLLTNVQVTHSGEYSLMVSNSFGSVTSSNAVLVVYIGVPTITSHPTNRSVQAGGNTTFSVSATGSPPLNYQWRHNANDIPGATNVSLLLTNLQFAQSGLYSVVVTNIAGSVTSSNAVLSVTHPPAVVQTLPVAAMGGASVVVPIALRANGDENTLAFSLSFPTNRFTYGGAVLGSGAAGAALAVYTNNHVDFGRIGLAVSFPGTNTFAAGTQQVVNLLLHSSFVTGTSNVFTSLTFGDVPLARQLMGAQGQILSASYVSASIALLPSLLEADTAPRPTGSQAVLNDDWQQIGRFVARLDTVNAGSELQRADCAPRSTFGDGKIKVTDFVQAGRFSAGLDPLTLSGGPASETTPDVPTGGLRTLRLAGGNSVQNVVVTVPVELQSHGNENSLAFSVSFNPAAFSYNGCDPGASVFGATFMVNTNQIGLGRLGVLVGLPTGAAFPAGTREVAKIRLVPKVSGVGTNVLTFTDLPVPRGQADALAGELSATYLDDAIIVNPPPALAIELAGTNVTLSWPAWAGGFSLQTATNLRAPVNWTTLAGLFATNGGSVVVTQGTPESPKFFRLFHP